MCWASQQVLSHISSFSFHNGSVLWSHLTDEMKEQKRGKACPCLAVSWRLWPGSESGAGVFPFHCSVSPSVCQAHLTLYDVPRVSDPVTLWRVSS